MRIDTIPDELKALPQWVVRKEKIPYNPKTKRPAKAGKPETWSSFEEAIKTYEDGGFSGIGFELNSNDIIGIDIDHCIDENTGEVSEQAQRIVDTLDSYTELSPSGLGLHIFVKGDIPADGRKNPQKGLEVYKAKRYLTVTGLVFGEQKPIAERDLSSFYNEHFQEDEEGLADLVLIEKAKQAENGELFADLFDGNWRGRYRSQSEADLAFCNLLAYWTEGDKEQIDRIFRASGLYREKWNRLGEQTITKALKSLEKKPVELKKSLDFQPYSVADLLKKDLPPLKWLVEGLIPEGLTLLAAPPKSGKSWWSLDLSLSVARGLPFLGRPTTKAGVLYLALEDGQRRIQSRTRKLLQENADPPTDFVCVHKIEPIGYGFEERFEEYVQACDNLGLVIIDTLEKVRGEADTKNLYKQDYKDAGLIKELADRYKIAIIVIHHTKKGKDLDDPFTQISGSFGLLGAVDSAMVIDKPKRNDTRANLLITGRDVDRQELVLEFDTDKSKWTYLDEERIESQREKDYNKDPIVTTIKDLCTFGPWKGGTADLQAEIEKRTGVQFDVLELGRRIIKLVSPLLEFDNITYSSTKPGNKKVHRFEQEYNT